jgi:hypothetical protein
VPARGIQGCDPSSPEAAAAFWQDMSVCVVELTDDNVEMGKVLCLSRRRVAVFHSPSSKMLPDLKPNVKYLVLPLSFNCLGDRDERREFVISIYTRHCAKVTPRPVTAKEVGMALVKACRQYGKKKEAFPQLGMTMFEVSCGSS